MSIYDFCGTWVERKDGDSLEPIMRAMKVRESKIQDSLNAIATQRLWVKGSTLITAYSSEFGEVASTFAVNGGWRMSTKKATAKQVLSRCTYDSKRRTLLIEKKMAKQGGILRDERRVERDEAGVVHMRQRLEFVPIENLESKITNISAPVQNVTAIRLWERSNKNWIDTFVDQLRGVWIADEEASESLRPIFEAMNLPPSSIRSALALRTQHTIFVSGPRELIFINQSLHGDLKSVVHIVRDVPEGGELQYPENGRMSCFAVPPNKIIMLSSSEDGLSSNRDERIVSPDLMNFQQTITFSQLGGTSVTVNRRWKRASINATPWAENLPLLKHYRNGEQRSVMIVPATPSTQERSGFSRPTPSTSSPPSRMMLSTPASPVKSRLDLSNSRGRNLAQELAAVPLTDEASTQSPTSSNRLVPNPFVGMMLVLVVCTAARFFIKDDMLLVCVGVPFYLLARSLGGIDQFQAGISSDSNTEAWLRTVIMLLVSTIALFFPSESSEWSDISPNDAMFSLCCIMAWAASRFFAPSRSFAFKSSADLWVAIAVALLVATLAIFFTFPKVFRGDDEREPGLGALSLVAVSAYVVLRAHASYGFVPVESPVEDDGIGSRNFSISVDKHRISDDGNFAEYQVVVTLPSGQKFSSWQRYSAFRALRRAIQREDLQFPSKRMFGNISPDVLDARLRDLDAFVKQIFAENGQEKYFKTSHEIRSFVGAPPI